MQLLLATGLDSCSNSVLHVRASGAVDVQLIVATINPVIDVSRAEIVMYGRLGARARVLGEREIAIEEGCWMQNSIYISNGRALQIHNTVLLLREDLLSGDSLKVNCLTHFLILYCSSSDRCKYNYVV